MQTKKHRVNLAINNELYEKIKKQAAAYAMPVATYCTMAVKCYSDSQAAEPTKINFDAPPSVATQ